MISVRCSGQILDTIQSRPDAAPCFTQEGCAAKGVMADNLWFSSRVPWKRMSKYLMLHLIPFNSTTAGILFTPLVTDLHLSSFVHSGYCASACFHCVCYTSIFIYPTQLSVISKHSPWLPMHFPYLWLRSQ